MPILINVTQRFVEIHLRKITWAHKQQITSAFTTEQQVHWHSNKKIISSRYQQSTQANHSRLIEVDLNGQTAEVLKESMDEVQSWDERHATLLSKQLCDGQRKKSTETGSQSAHDSSHRQCVNVTCTTCLSTDYLRLLSALHGSSH